MKKNLFKATLLMLIMIFVFGSVSTHAWEYKYVGSEPITDTSVSLDGRLLEFDASPQIVNNRTMVPLTEFAEMLNAEAMDVEKHDDILSIAIKIPLLWNNSKAWLNFYADTLSYAYFTNDYSERITDGDTEELDSPPIEIDGQIYVPLRAICNALRYKIVWEQDIMYAHIASLHRDNYDPAYAADSSITMGTYTCEAVCDNHGRRLITVYAEDELSDDVFLETENGEYLFFRNGNDFTVEKNENGYKYSINYVPFPDTYTIYCYPTKDGEVANMRTQLDVEWNRR